MLELEQAGRLVREAARPLPPQRRPLSRALGAVLAEDVPADADSPPFDRAMVDGFALRAADCSLPNVELEVQAEVFAGDAGGETLRPPGCIRIMTGAPLPAGADAVVMVEQSVARSSTTVQLTPAAPVTPGQHVQPRGSLYRQGRIVLHAGHRLRPQELALLCEVGREEVQVHPRPRASVLATGDELLAPGEPLRPGKIRNSNSTMLAAAVEQAGGEGVDLGIVRDRRDELLERISQALTADLVLLSGGVSAGVLDLVPGVLRELGVCEVFHKVRLKPGKPLWFGARHGGAGEPDTLVFGLPGNPVSSLVCFELFVRPALEQMAGLPGAGRPRVRLELATGHAHRGDRPTFFPGRLLDEEPRRVELLRWQGSADLLTLASADCLVHFPAGDRAFAAGALVDAVLI